MLRHDGLYISRLPVDYGAMLSHSYLRFYPDGTVIESSIRGEPSIEVTSWFDKSDPSISSGQFNIRGDRIEFSVKSEAGIVEYSGEILSDDLQLHFVSHINGNYGDDDYGFVRF
jgi:hypothetical protein